MLVRATPAAAAFAPRLAFAGYAPLSISVGLICAAASPLFAMSRLVSSLERRLMNKNESINVGMAICGGIILGALIDNMAIGLMIGFAVAFGLFKVARRGS